MVVKSFSVIFQLALVYLDVVAIVLRSLRDHSSHESKRFQTCQTEESL